MFVRNIINELGFWKDKIGRKPLLLRGARQVGKTSAVRLFAEKHFETLIELNLEKTDHKALFTEVGAVQNLIQALEVKFGKAIAPGKTLLFIDEVQESEIALQQLRYFFEEMPSLHVVAAGSLFEVALAKQRFSIPVGRVEYLYMFPLSFDEFLIAKGNSKARQVLNEINLDTPISAVLHVELQRHFLEYAFLGGMPEVIAKYAETKSILSLYPIYESVLTGFNDDVLKYATQAEAVYIRHVMQAAPRCVGQQITYNHFAESNYRSREISLAFDALDLALITTRVFSSRSLALPLVPNRRKAPKIIFVDTGLCNYSIGQRQAFRSFSELENNYQGQITEQIVGQALKARSATAPELLTYWYREKAGSTAELDYLIALKGDLLGIEVKAGAVGKLKSLMLFVDEAKAKRAVRIYGGEKKVEQLKTPNGRSFELISLPIYLVHRLTEILS